MAVQFDMFAGGEREKERKPGRAATFKPHAPSELTEAEMVQRLEDTGKYRILKKLEPRAVANIARTEFPLRGVIVDTLTTGLDHRKCEIIEIGLISFTFDATGNIGDVTGV